MQEQRRKYSPEFKTEAVRLVVETSRPIVDGAREIGVHEWTLGSWVNKYRAEHAGDEPPLTLSERARLRELERGNREFADENRVLGEIRCLLRAGVSVTDKFAFIDAEKAMFPIVKMCTWVDVSTSGYYEWRHRPASATAQRRQRLAAVIQAIFDESDGTYGYRRVHAALVRQGDDCGPELVREIMRQLGLVPCQPRPWRPTTTQPGDGADAVPDLVGRDFSAEVPGQKLVGDIT